MLGTCGLDLAIS